MYDPCPVGWRVPDGGSSGIWSNADFDDTDYDDTNEGMSFINSDLELWYPAAGYRYDRDGSLSGFGSIGNFGYYWSATSRDNKNAYDLKFYYLGSVDASNYDTRAHGYSVRCLQE